MKIYIEYNEALYPVNTEELQSLLEFDNFCYADLDSAEFDICNGNEIYLKRQPEIVYDRAEFIVDLEDCLTVMAVKEESRRK